MDVILELAGRIAVVHHAHRVAVVHHGAFLACDTPAAVMANANVQAAYLGEPL